MQLAPLRHDLGDAQYILADNPDLQRVHSAASIRSVLKKSGVPLARDSDDVGAGQRHGGEGYSFDEYHGGALQVESS